MPTVDFICDFGSPNAYLCHRVLPALAARTGAEFNYIPCLLGGIFKATGNQSPFTAFAGIRNKPQYDNLEMMRFVQKHRLPFRMNPFFPVNTLSLMRGAMAAVLEGQHVAYTEAMFHYMWEEPRQLDNPEVFRQTLSDAGFDAETILRRMADPEVKQALIDNTNAAVERGVFGIPTFFVGSEMWFGKDRLRDLEEYLLTGVA